MTEYHTIYKGPAGETTQWEDIQRKMGNLPPKEPVFKPDKYAPEQEEVCCDRHCDPHAVNTSLQPEHTVNCHACDWHIWTCQGTCLSLRAAPLCI